MVHCHVENKETKIPVRVPRFLLLSLQFVRRLKMSSSVDQEVQLGLRRHRSSDIYPLSRQQARNRSRHHVTEPRSSSHDDLVERSPTQLRPAGMSAYEEMEDTEDSDEDLDLDRFPFSYFLTPIDDDDDDDDNDDGLEDLNLSAGIEDDQQREPIIRTVSPSQLSGLSEPPSLSSSTMTSDASDSDEDNVEHDDNSLPQEFDLPISLYDLTSAFEKRQVRYNLNSPTSALSTGLKARGILKSPSRGRAPRNGRNTPRRRSWREPSPDVWSIAEEDETMEKPMLEKRKSVKRVHFEFAG